MVSARGQCQLEACFPRPTTERSRDREGLFGRNDDLSRPRLPSVTALRLLTAPLLTHHLRVHRINGSRLSCSGTSSLGSSRASKPSQPLDSPWSGSNVDISLHNILNITHLNQNAIGNKTLIPSPAAASVEDKAIPKHQLPKSAEMRHRTRY
jgi:hypothetical protein